MLVATSVARDTRVLREAQTLVDDGYSVTVIGRNVPEDFQPPKGISVLTASGGSGLRPSTMGSLTTRKLPQHLRLLRWFLLPKHRAKSFGAWAQQVYAIASSMEFGIVHAHDFTALEIGHRLSREHGVPLIYDSHEWWLGRQRQYRPTPLTDRKEAALEAKWAKNAAAVITVGESIAQLMQTKRGLKHVYVVRNSFPTGTEDFMKIASPPTGIIYAGRIDAYRELEVTMELAERSALSICWMGEHENQWAATHVPRARKLGIEVLSAQPISAVTRAMKIAGLVFVTHSNQFESHRLALPNKLFHAVHAGVPVIATNVTELARVVREYDLGELYEPGDSTSMEAAVARAVERHSELILNVKAAQAELSWDRDAQVLRDLYAQALKAVPE